VDKKQTVTVVNMLLVICYLLLV